MSELRRNIDRCDATLIAGWIDENGPVAEVDIEINGRWPCSVAPTSFREDLKEAGIGDGRRSFEFSLAGRLQQGANRIVVSRKGTPLYENSIFLPPLIEDSPARAMSQRRWRGDEPPEGLTWGRLMTGDSLWDLYQSKRKFANTDKILEVGPGYGRLLKTAIERKIPFAFYTGVDLSAERVTKLRQGFPMPRVQFTQGDIDIWEGDQSYDIVLSSATFEHLYPDFRNALKNIRRQMASGGQVFIDFIPSDSATRGFEADGTYVRSYTGDELLSIFTECGYIIRATEWCRLGEGEPGPVERWVVVADIDRGQLQQRADELVARLQSAQTKLSKTWYGRQILQRGLASVRKAEAFRRSLSADARLSNDLAMLETAVALHVEACEFDIAMRLIQDRAAGIYTRTWKRGWISGSERLDRLCLSIGREIFSVAGRRSPAPQAGRRRYVYVVSELYREGGHTRVLEDLIAAQPRADHEVIWTWGESADAIAVMSRVLRVGNAVRVYALHGEPVDRLRAAFAFLAEPDVLVHLAHANDPIAIALMQPGIARRCIMIHHCDSSFALGRSLECLHVALGRHFQDAVRREWDLETAFLPLTCAEPAVTKGAGWARDRPLLTVTSGSSSKFDLNGELSYLDILTERFAAREGLHVHIGSLTGEQMSCIEQHLDKLGCRERFVYREHVPDLRSALCELAPSVYIDSYPIGGGRAIVEAMAAGVPICAATHDPNLDSSSFSYPERLWWTHPAQVGTILATLDPTAVERHAALSRRYFERYHSPTAFKRRLQALVS